MDFCRKMRPGFMLKNTLRQQWRGRYYNEKDGITMLNTVALHGRLTAAPELKHTPNDIAVTSFSLAVNSGYGDKQKVAFIDCVAWRSTAEFICKYFVKGQEMGLSGTLQTRTYEDRHGSNRKVTEVIAREVDFCGQKASGQAQPPAPKATAKKDSKAPTLPEYDADDDLPF